MTAHGLFTREDLKTGGGARPAVIKPADVPAARLWEIGLTGVAAMNPAAKTKHMAPAGAERPLVYILGEAPGENEDSTGMPFVGKAGRTLRAAIPRGMEGRTRFDNACRTRPPNNRTPEYAEIECYRPSVIESVEAAKPAVLLCVGLIPIRWALGPGPNAAVMRGRRFPVRIGAHVCWCYPTYHPSYVNRVQDARTEEGMPGAEIARMFTADVARAYADAARLPPPRIRDDAPEILSAARLFTGGPTAPVLAAFAAFAGSKAPVGFDIETNALRPYGRGAKLLSFAVGTGAGGFALAFDHPQATWGAAEKKAIAAALQSFLESPVPKVAHNLAFEQEWIAHLFGLPAIRRGVWNDTLAGAYVLDERAGGHSLDFLCLEAFGVHLKAISNLDRAKLEAAPIADVLRYNLLDSVFTARLRSAQIARLKSEGLVETYRAQVRRVPTLVTAQVKGFPVAPARVTEFQSRLAADAAALQKRIAADPATAAYEARYGRFNPASPQQVIQLFHGMLGRKELRRGEGLTADEKALAALKDVPLAGLILSLRKLGKLRGTYVDPLDPASKETVVWPDGRIHPHFSSTSTDSRRLSSDSPNAQNYPIREHPEIRGCFAAPPGYTILKTDYGQIEARVIAMAAKDKTLVDALWTGYDIHAAWAERINKAWPKTCKERYGGFDKAALKKFRGDVKAAWVFASFYGAGWRTTAGRFGMDEKVCRRLFDEFWDDFRGVKRWQDDTVDFYREKGHVETLTGWRRRGPLNFNQIINTPIQGTASDIVVDAMCRLAERADAAGDPHLAPALNIHDDLSGIVPTKRLDYYREIYVAEMLAVPFDFVNVPISIEVAAGTNWAECATIGTYASNDPASV